MKRSKRILLTVGATVLCLSLLTVGAMAGKKKVPHPGTSTQVESSSFTDRNITVSGVIQSRIPKCERSRSLKLYWDGSTGDFTGNPIGQTISQGGVNRGQYTINGLAPKKILDSRRFRVEAVGKKVVVKGKTYICKRGVSVQFPGTFGG